MSQVFNKGRNNIMIDPGYTPVKEIPPILQNSYTPTKQEAPDILAGMLSLAECRQSYIVVIQENAKSRGDITQGKFMVFNRLNGESISICTTDNFKTATIFNQDKKFIKELISLSFPSKSFTFMNIEKND